MARAANIFAISDRHDFCVMLAAGVVSLRYVYNQDIQSIVDKTHVPALLVSQIRCVRRAQRIGTITTAHVLVAVNGNLWCGLHGSCLAALGPSRHRRLRPWRPSIGPVACRG